MIIIPLASYRIQFNPQFTFAHCEEILEYLTDLGVSDIYASPIFRARAGSEHGYDICDHDQINPELGGEEGLARLTLKRQAVGMGWIQDIVPNHMAFSPQNTMLVDVLENGAHSRFYDFFDINWDHHDEAMKGRVLAPFLGGFYGETLEKGELSLVYGEEGFHVKYYEFLWPLNIESYDAILTQKLKSLLRRLGRDHPDFVKLLGILYIIRTLAAADDQSERYDQIAFIKRMLYELHVNNEVFREYIHATLDLFNGHTGLGSGDRRELLDELLNEQFYRLSYWKVAADEINYRRFFSINELISLKVEQEEVSERLNRLVFEKTHDEVFTGLRIDHVDGLYDPAAYLAGLREGASESYILVEKILELEEQLPSAWPVQGTTGYDFMNYVNMLQCDPRNSEAFTNIYKAVTGVVRDFDNIIVDKKRLIIEQEMSGDVSNLALSIKRIADKDRHGKDLTLYGLHRALMEVLVLFPVYRSYINRESFTEQDRGYIRMSMDRAMRRRPDLFNELSYIRRFLLLEFPDYLPEEEKSEWVEFAMRFQQFTGPLMAKGFEDTALYVYNRLVSLNEVGSDPSRFGLPAGYFHDFISARQAAWPYSLNCTASHDTKRGEDLRCRINVLSELPDQWRLKVDQWTRMNSGYKTLLENEKAPDKNDEYFYYQTLIGAFPFSEEEHPEFPERMKQYAIKAVREAKVHTAWLKPDTEYEEAFAGFIEATLDINKKNEFLTDFKEFQRIIAHYGMINSLAQVLLKITCPGVPDFYQGTELWDLNLVDPDNRRPVDFDHRRRLLSDIKTQSKEDLGSLIQDLLNNAQDGRIKLFTITTALKVRRDYREVFQNGEYIPLEASGKYSENIIAFMRRYGEKWLLVAVPRFSASLCGYFQWPLDKDVWRDTYVDLSEQGADGLINCFTNQMISTEGRIWAGDLFSQFPVGLFIGGAKK